MQSIENKILSRIYGHGRGWVFTKDDFSPDFAEPNINQALSTLTKLGKIRRIHQGVYDYPEYSEIVGCQVPPDSYTLADVLARKFNWRIHPLGDAALNMLGLSTQVPAYVIYHSDGPNRKYKVGNRTLEFRHRSLKDTGFKYKDTGVVVQALKALGKRHVDKEIINSIRKVMGPIRCKRIFKDAQSTTGWVYETIKQICSEIA